LAWGVRRLAWGVRRGSSCESLWGLGGWGDEAWIRGRGVDGLGAGAEAHLEWQLEVMRADVRSCAAGARHLRVLHSSGGRFPNTAQSYLPIHKLIANLKPPPPTPTPTAAGVVAVDLGRQMLQIYPETYVLVVSHENLTSNWCVRVAVVVGGLWWCSGGGGERGAGVELRLCCGGGGEGWLDGREVIRGQFWRARRNRLGRWLCSWFEKQGAR